MSSLTFSYIIFVVVTVYSVLKWLPATYAWGGFGTFLTLTTSECHTPLCHSLLQDLKLLMDAKKLKHGSVVVADNLLIPGRLQTLQGLQRKAFSHKVRLLACSFMEKKLKLVIVLAQESNTT